MKTNLRIKNQTKHIIAPIEGMTCASCVARVERALTNTTGVSNVSVNLATEKVSFDFDPSRLKLGEIIKRVEDTGYKIDLSRFDGNKSGDLKESATVDTVSKQENELKNNFTLAVILSVPVLLLNMGMLWEGFYKIIPLTMGEIDRILLVLTTPIVFIAGRRFYKIFWQNLKHLTADMNTLVAIGTGSAYLYSAVITLFPGILSQPSSSAHVYFDTAAVIITLILMGRWLESRAKSRTGSAIKKLIELKPKTATVRKNGRETEINLRDLQQGDIVIVKPGEKIPADGIIKKGYSLIDESMITGESLPVEKKEGSKIIGGTLNHNRSFEFEVTALGDNSVLGQIIRMVEEAQGSKAPIQKLADRVSAVFVPAILTVAAFTFAGWILWGPGIEKALLNFVAVLIIACPCALGLATPTALIVGTGLGAQKGILIKNGESLELAHKINLIIFDKTGTITEGKPKVNSVFTYEIDENEFIKLVASLEKRSGHPLAGAIIDYAETKQLELYSVEEFENLTGFGLTGKVNGKQLLIGNMKLMENQSIEPSDFIGRAEGYSTSGGTIVYAAINNELKGLIVIDDPVKTGVPESIKKLKEMNLKTFMLTGDNEFSARAVAEKTGVDEFESDILPEEKINAVIKYQRKGNIVAMVGDGINDSPALAQSDVGIAIGNGTDIAIETGDIILMAADLKGVVNAINLSRKTIRTIKQNLFWAFIYNIIGVPLAAFGLLNPIFAAFAMSLSSVSVVSNSLRLKKMKL